MSARTPLLAVIENSSGGQDTKAAGRPSMPRCRNSVATTAEETPHIGNYRLLKTIGKGNFAKVKLARHVLTGKEVTHTHTHRLLNIHTYSYTQRHHFLFWQELLPVLL
uniref:Protein kinase domain-containing protein n=1 Tax=Hucho hucho TaxID=62062 RepID=A0A4W5N8J2_9TELE